MKFTSAFATTIALLGILPATHARVAYRPENPHESKSGKSSKSSTKSSNNTSYSKSGKGGSKSSKSGSKSGKSLKWIEEGGTNYDDYNMNGDDGSYFVHDDYGNYGSRDGSNEQYGDLATHSNNAIQLIPAAMALTEIPTRRPTRRPIKDPTTHPTLTATEPPTYFPTEGKISGIVTSTENTAAMENKEMFNLISKVSDPKSLRDQSSPQGKSFAWLTNTDPKPFPHDEEDSHHNLVLTQSYILAAFYYATGGDGWLHNDSWLSDEHICFWYGIDCSAMAGSLVKSITMPMNNLDGNIAQIEDELSYLKNFRELIVNDNYISGSFPKSIGGVGTQGGRDSVFRINVSNNIMSGTIDFDLFPKEKLISLKLDENFFSGSIAALAERTELKQLDLRNNDFSGTVSGGFGDLSNLCK